MIWMERLSTVNRNLLRPEMTHSSIKLLGSSSHWVTLLHESFHLNSWA